MVKPRSSKTTRHVFWGATGLFCLQMAFTAYAQLTLPEVAKAFAHLGFPDYFRVHLSCAKLLGVVFLLAPAPARLREWTYAGFAFDLGSAILAHGAMGDGPEAWGWAAATLALGAVSYVCWRRSTSAVRLPFVNERLPATAPLSEGLTP